jgi:thymidylate synthase (FAD)
MGEIKLKVILVRHTPRPEETVALAAKLCYSPSDVSELKKKISQKDQQAFIKKLVDIGHVSPVEHASFTFAIEGISRACSHQLVRHRLASYSQQSQRYVSMKSGKARGKDKKSGGIFDYVMPPSIAGDKELKAEFKKFMAQAQKSYDLMVEKLNARGIAGEAANQDARFVLPNAAETKIIVTMNARELMHFFAQRCCNRAQWEIHAMADEMLRLARAAAPTLFSASGPGCVIGACPEGDMTCGNVKDVRAKYRILQ